MFDSLMDALGVAGDALSAPGDYLRGALSGRLGERASGRDLLSSLGLDPGDGLGGRIAGFGTEVATDPLAYLGGALGRVLGGKASRAAEAMGPGYTHTAESLASIAPADTEAGARLLDLLGHPGGRKALGELPPGSSLLGMGDDALGLKTPAGDVLRLGLQEEGKAGRPMIDQVLQATRTADYPVGGGVAVRAERTPFADQVGNDAFWRARDPKTMLTPYDELTAGLKKNGMAFPDRHSGNVGVVGDQLKVIDPGAVAPLSDFTAATQPVIDAGQQPSALMRALTGLLGGQDRTREAIAQGLSGPDFRTELMLAGGGLGSVGGASGRAVRSQR